MQIVLGSVSVIFLLIIGSATAALKWKDCGSKDGKITTLKVSDCNDDPCILKRGTNVTVTMDFTANVDIDKAVIRVYGYVASIKVPFKVQDSNACDFMKCPIKKGSPDEFTMQLPIESIYPPVTVIIQWELHLDSATGDMVTCFEIRGKIQ